MGTTLAVSDARGVRAMRLWGRTVEAWWASLAEAAGRELVWVEAGEAAVDASWAATPVDRLRGPRVDPLGPQLDSADPVSAMEVQAQVVADAAARLLAGGVHLIDPARIVVEPWVEVAPGATLWPEVVLRGRTRVGAGAEVRPGCWIEDSEIGDGAVILPHSVLGGAQVGAGAQVGPMAHLRPGAVLEAEAKVGNWVEVKNARLGRGAKASHLSYLGDAEIGAGANVGAGTITCNYDGFRKHRTSIGAGAFIGSNSALVAPIRVGAGAIVGAGSVITRDVPDDALAVERAPQKVLEGKARVLNERNKRAKASHG
jgi:bifunctional UDP-N-acetylglucosamine pyrophosphorylase/glucosamine-1-phosphate N-acetyltransferase